MIVQASLCIVDNGLTMKNIWRVQHIILYLTNDLEGSNLSKLIFGTILILKKE